MKRAKRDEADTGTATFYSPSFWVDYILTGWLRLSAKQFPLVIFGKNETVQGQRANTLAFAYRFLHVSNPFQEKVISPL